MTVWIENPFDNLPREGSRPLRFWLMARAFVQAGVRVQPVMETYALLPLALAVEAGGVASVLPGALVAVLRHHGELQARPLVEPAALTPLAFATFRQAPVSRVQQAALALAADPAWLAHAAEHSGALGQNHGARLTRA